MTRHRSTCPCLAHPQPFERLGAQIALIAGLTIIAVALAALLVAWIGVS